MYPREHQLHKLISRGVTGIFFWGGKVIFPDFFHAILVVSPKTNFRRFQKWKAKKKKKKKKKRSWPFWPFAFFSSKFSPLFPFFLASFSPHTSAKKLPLAFFSSKFSPLFPFFLASFFPIRQQKFTGQKSRGGGCSPPPVGTAHQPKSPAILTESDVESA